MAINASGLNRISRFSSLNSKLTLSFLLLGIAPLLALGWYSIKGSTDQLADAAAHRLAGC
jgi:hypothetical protein